MSVILSACYIQCGLYSVCVIFNVGNTQCVIFSAGYIQCVLYSVQVILSMGDIQESDLASFCMKSASYTRLCFCALYYVILGYTSCMSYTQLARLDVYGFADSSEIRSLSLVLRTFVCFCLQYVTTVNNARTSLNKKRGEKYQIKYRSDLTGKDKILLKRRLFKVHPLLKAGLLLTNDPAFIEILCLSMIPCL